VRVLIVDDEVRIRVNVARVLSRRGFLMDMAGSVSEAKEMLAAQKYDAALVDWQLPDGTGLEITGADDYVVKQDIDFEEVGSRLRAVARRRAAPPHVP
jgi:DNA-binding response OmpR family regulator